MDTIEKVVSMYQDFFHQDINAEGVRCIRHNLEANEHFMNKRLDEAIDCYNRALEVDFPPLRGISLTKRSQAHLELALHHNSNLKGLGRTNVDFALFGQDEQASLMALALVLSPGGAVQRANPAAFMSGLAYLEKQLTNFQQASFHHSMYKVALLQAKDDALRAIELLPHLRT